MYIIVEKDGGSYCEIFGYVDDEQFAKEICRGLNKSHLDYEYIDCKKLSEDTFNSIYEYTIQITFNPCRVISAYKEKMYFLRNALDERMGEYTEVNLSTFSLKVLANSDEQAKKHLKRSVKDFMERYGHYIVNYGKTIDISRVYECIEDASFEYKA